jgi:hypothetical protein
MAFLLALFGAVSAAFHSVQRAMAETAAATGVQVAAGGTPLSPGQPDLAGAIDPTEAVLRPVLWGTRVTVPENWAAQPQGQPCAPLQSIPQDTLQVCVWRPADTGGQTGMVAETVRGHPAYVVPFLAQLLPWSIDVTVETHEVSYQA